MTTHTHGRFVNGAPVTHISDGDTIEGGNYMQLVPDTDVFAGIENVTVEGGNFANCRKPATWTIRGGNWVQASRCSHLHPEWPELPQCPEECGHVVEQIDIEVDGEVIDTVYTYKDTIL